MGVHGDEDVDVDVDEGEEEERMRSPIWLGAWLLSGRFTVSD